MSYLAWKTAHVIAVLAWVTTLLGTSWIVGYFAARPVPRDESTQALLTKWRDWEIRFGTGSMAMLLGLGLVMATHANWFAFRWLQLKLLLVMAQLALHGVGAGRLRRMSVDADYSPSGRWLSLLQWLAIACIVTLVVCKPGFARH